MPVSEIDTPRTFKLIPLVCLTLIPLFYWISKIRIILNIL